MPYNAPPVVTTGQLALASDWNTYIKDNIIELRGGGVAIASQAAGDIVYASSATQLARLANAYGVVKCTGSGGVSIGPASNLRCDQESAGRCVLPVGADKWAS
jgi:hypothetical protein